MCIINFINNTNEDNSTNEISEMYSVDGDGNLQLVNAQMNKTTNKNDSNSAIKYDLIKNSDNLTIYSNNNDNVIEYFQDNKINIKNSYEYSFLIASKVINGRVPSFYGNSMISSRITNVPIKI